MQSTLLRQQRLTLSQLEYACETLERLYQACHWRKIELYLIPALQNATEQANQLLDELSRLNQAALAVIRRLQSELDLASEHSERQVADICAAIETFCTVLLQRLEKEEKELFSIARTAIGGEAWFDIANKFLAHDAQVVEARRSPAAADKDRKALSQARQVRASLRNDDEAAVPVPKLRYHRRMRSAHRAAADTA
ncbi:hemerythrin domain-containing protein [Pseudoduganella sp.]|uniref:hemerythrin domain-containing protein n=1 Tax=Pseudoduganella sp. TaxID=1880898 RepID=UPI0035ADAE4C